MADEGGPPTLQLVTGSGEFNLQGLDDFSKSVSIYEQGLSYVIVAIVGPQSSGKSTLLNALFKTKFRMMDFLKGRGQTTQGIWLAPASVDLKTFTLVLDLEGTDGRERGEDDTAFEKQSTLFALAVADVIIVNMWCHDIGREHAANKPLLKTVFQVMMRLFLPRKATLLFVIRDKTKTPIESLEPILREDLERIWASVPKPEQHKNTTISDFFNIEVTWLPNFEEKEEEFASRVLSMRARFDNAIAPGEIAGDRTGVVPAQALPLSMEGIWERIKLNKDLDLPAHKVMVATVRCEQIADEKMQSLLASEDWAALKGMVEKDAIDVSIFGTKTNELAGNCLDSYEQEALYFEEKVRNSKKEQLIARLKETISPVHGASVSRISKEALDTFKKSLNEATGGDQSSSANFAVSSRKCSAEAISSFQETMAGMDVPLIGLEVESARKGFAAAVEKFTAELRKEKLKIVEDNAVEFLLAGLSGPVKSILETGKVDAWQRINVLWKSHVGQCKAEVKEALEGFEMSQEEQNAVLTAVESKALKAIEDKTRDLSKAVLPLMKERFTTIFMHDSDGMPRRWTKSVDVHKLLREARLAALGVLACVAAVQLDLEPKPEAGTITKRELHVVSPILPRLMHLLDENDDEAVLSSTASQPNEGSEDEVVTSREVSHSSERKGLLLSKTHGKGSLRLWENIDASLTFLSPEDCRATWKNFKKETLFQIAQALQAQEASNSNSWLPPPWALAAIIILGWNEFMAIIRNPMLALLLLAIYFFGRAIWMQVSGEDLFRHGMVPGLLALSSRIVPAVLRVFQHLVEASQTQLAALNAAQQPQSQYAGYSPQPAQGQQLPNVVNVMYTNGLASTENSVSSSPAPKAGQELRQRPASSRLG